MCRLNGDTVGNVRRRSRKSSRSNPMPPQGLAGTQGSPHGPCRRWLNWGSYSRSKCPFTHFYTHDHPQFGERSKFRGRSKSRDKKDDPPKEARLSVDRVQREKSKLSCLPQKCRFLFCGNVLYRVSRFLLQVINVGALHAEPLLCLGPCFLYICPRG